MKRNAFPYKKLIELLEYNKETGVFHWKLNRNGAKKGTVAGGKLLSGHMAIGIYGKKYLSHRLAWLYTYGYMPEHNIDHINRDPSDNRIKNLREASQSCNMFNAEQRSDNTSGIKGISYDNRRKNWRATIRLNGRDPYLGSYKSFDNAVCARLAAEQCIGVDSCDKCTPAKAYVDRHITIPIGNGGSRLEDRPIDT